MSKWVCSVCGYTVEGELRLLISVHNAKQVKEKFNKAVGGGDREWADQHVVGVAKGVDAEILQGLKDNFMENARK